MVTCYRRANSRGDIMIFFKKRPILTHIILLGVFIGTWILFDLLGMSAWYTINNIASPFYPDTIRYASFFSGFASITSK